MLNEAKIHPIELYIRIIGSELINLKMYVSLNFQFPDQNCRTKKDPFFITESKTLYTFQESKAIKKGKGPNLILLDHGAVILEIVADPLNDLPPLGAVLQEPLGASLLHLLRHRGERREWLAGDPCLLPEHRSVVGIPRIRAVQ